MKSQEERVISIELQHSAPGERPSFGFTLKGGKGRNEVVRVESVALGT